MMKRPFSLSPRLQAVADLVPQGAKLADVGTDHGRLPVWLIQNGVVSQAVASDLRVAPLLQRRSPPGLAPAPPPSRPGRLRW